MIEKTRHFVMHNNHQWEIDEFDGENAGLIVAEIELEEANETFTKPNWIGADVTQDMRYYNNNLAKYPYSQWRDDA